MGEQFFIDRLYSLVQVLVRQTPTLSQAHRVALTVVGATATAIYEQFIKASSSPLGILNSEHLGPRSSNLHCNGGKGAVSNFEARQRGTNSNFLDRRIHLSWLTITLIVPIIKIKNEDKVRRV